MASLYVTEYRRFGRDNRGQTIPAPKTPPVAQDKVAIDVTSTDSAVFSDETRLVELHCDAICHIAWATDSQVKSGSRPAATTDLKRLPADTTQFFTVDPGGGVATIQGT